MTYCGELFGKYGFSRHWVNPEADLFIGAVPETCAMARLLGMPANRTEVGGFLLNPSFYHTPLTAAERAACLRDRLGLDPERFTVLLSTGEHGANNHLSFLDAIQKQQPRNDLQIIALCGRHPQELAKVQAWARQNRGLPVVALPHSHEMHLLMQMADVVVGRPGTGTTSEAIISGCPIIFNTLGGFMPQEWITMRFAHRHEIAEEAHRADQLPAILARWHADPEQYARLRRQIIDCRPHAHPREILSLVTGVAQDVQRPPSPGSQPRPYVQLEDEYQTA